MKEFQEQALTSRFTELNGPVIVILFLKGHGHV